MNNSTCLRKLKFWHNFRLTLLELELFIASLPLIGQAFADVGPQHRRLLPRRRRAPLRRRRGVGGAEGRVGGGTDGAGGVAHQPPEATDGRALAAAELAAALRHRAGVAARPAQAEHGLRRRDAADGARPRPAARRRPLGVVVAAQRCQQIALAGRYRRLDRVLPSFFFFTGFSSVLVEYRSDLGFAFHSRYCLVFPDNLCLLFFLSLAETFRPVLLEFYRNCSVLLSK